jgi:5-formyltetrahydrofolate cyclo-ligase
VTDPTNSPAKEALRARMLSVRAALPAAERAAASSAIAARVAALPAWDRARTVVLHAALGAEVDVSELARRALAGGKRIAWPRMRGAGHAMELACCAPGELVPGPARALEPPASAPPLPLHAVDVVVVPGVAFDAAGGRLGRGRGHYDATLAALPPGAAKVGVGFDAQVIDLVPRDPHDVQLDVVVTESRVLGPGGLAGHRPG